MKTLTFNHWELCELTTLYHELRNTRLVMHETKQISTVIMNRTEALFDKLRFAEFEERASKNGGK
jgi:hypothetical protein